jgi:DNA-binding MarR family transcriptional regulator
LIRDLRVSKQAASQLVDTLVMRGYLQRTTDPEDRRRLNVTLTERGNHAAVIQAAARQRIDKALQARAGAENVLRTRKTLAALIDIGREETGAVKK